MIQFFSYKFVSGQGFSRRKAESFRRIISSFLQPLNFKDMPRRSSGGRSAPRPRPVAARSPPPQTVNRAPPPATAQASGGGGSILGGIGSTIADGMGFGTGSSIAHRALDFVMGPRTFRHETVVSEAVSAASPVAKTVGSG